MSQAQIPQPEPASDDDMVEFMRFLYENRLRVTRWPDLDDPKLRDALPEEFRDKLPSIARRFISDVMKRPSPPGLLGPAGGGPAREPRAPEGKGSEPARPTPPKRKKKKKR